MDLTKEKVQKAIDNLSFPFPYSAEEWMEHMYLENYHCHKDFSNTAVIDCAEKIENYAERILEYGSGKCLYSGEHGSQGNQFHVYKVAEQYGLKYRHSAEVYWVKDRHEKDRANCHMMIVAKNPEGRKDLNYILSVANEDGYYGQPRIDLELLLSVKPENFIVTSSCIAGFRYPEADKIWLKIADHFGKNFFFEVQNHNTQKQKDLNARILKLAKENNIPIMCGLDSHYVLEENRMKREWIQKYKKIQYNDDESGWYMDYPDTKTVIQRFEEQGILNEEQILEAVLNTNVFVNECEEIVLDKHFKIPNIHPELDYEGRVKLLKRIVSQEYKKEKYKTPEKRDGIVWEVSQYVESGTVDYPILNKAIVDLAVGSYGGELTRTSRGSAASFVSNKLMHLTTVDRFTAEVPIYPERFLTKERILSGAMPDVDANLAHQEPFVQATRELLGEHSCYPMMTLSNLKEKAAWKLYAGSQNVEPATADKVSKFIDQYNKDLKYADEDDKEFIRIEDYIPAEYLDIYKESLSYQGITINNGVHACFKAGTNVLTWNGYKPIETIRRGELVYTHKGRFKPVYYTSKKNVQKAIMLKVGGIEIESTRYHRFLAKTKEDIEFHNEPQWVPASKLSGKYYLGVPINQESWEPDYPYDLPFDNNDFWWLVGRYLGDGWYEEVKNRTEIRLIICCSKVDGTSDLNDITKRLEGLFSYRVEESRTTYKIFINSKTLYFWIQMFGKYAHGKLIPSSIQNLSVDKLRSLLDGYFSADGHKRNEADIVEFSTISYEMALGIRNIIHKVFRQPCRFYIRESQNYKIEGRLVTGSTQYRGVIDFSRGSWRKFVQEGEYVWYQVEDKRNVEHFESQIYYDLTVLDDSSYTVENYAVHNCGHLVFDGDIRREIGLISAKSETTGERTLVAAVEGKYLDEFGYVKEDFLIVDSVALTAKMFKSIGEEVPSFDELKEMVKNDPTTWDIYAKGITCCINQCERASTTQKVMRYKPQTIGELASFIAAIRPAMASLVNQFINRRPYTTGEAKIDELLEDSAHYMLYQESIMKILSFLGLEMQETYKVIKSISKKKLKGKMKDDLLIELKENWQRIFGNTDNFGKVWKVIEDAASYGFSGPHAYSMAGDSLYLAWFKAHHTAKFYEVAISHYQEKEKKDKIDALVKECMEFYGYRLGAYEFGNDNRRVNLDEKNKIIYPNLSSIKGFGEKIVDQLYEAGLKQYRSFREVYQAIQGTAVNKTQLTNLAKLGYFRKYGNENQILSLISLYNFVSDLKTRVSKTKLQEQGIAPEKVLQFGRETKSMLMDLRKEEMVAFLESEIHEPEPTDYQRLQWQMEVTGMVDEQIVSFPKNEVMVTDIDIRKGITNLKLYSPSRGKATSVKMYTKGLEAKQFQVGSFIRINQVEKRVKTEFTGNILPNGRREYKPVASGEKEAWLKSYTVIGG